jgi:signal peptidase I
MVSTIVFAAVFVGLLLASVALWALFLRLGLRWAKVPDVTMHRVVVATVIVFVLQVGLSVMFLFVSRTSGAQSIVLAVVELASGVLVPCVVIRTVFKAHFLRAFQAWLPTLLAPVVTIAFALLVLRPLLYEAFVVPTNAMAPTLVGEHWQGTCPKCGQANYCSPRDERYATVGPSLMICDNFHVTETSDVGKTVYSGDRFMVAKFLTPRRWDLVVFKSPEEPTTLNVKRLVGFPGEKIHIQDGSVWVDGKKQIPPDSLRGIEYLSELPGWRGPDLWGSANRPALLANDEYFVLGDFSAQSKDSRVWQQGAPRHHSYAVPESYMIGVVTHTYWPLHRWRIHR